ncbi:shikimate dehydrogenase [Microbacterium sp. NPDC055910]|uniref:shikimate dehydrogenase n=1 Tax=Microbacterium sp. NPDC055910 TaxID=3345659 RepID=UPI0035D666FE
MRYLIGLIGEGISASLTPRMHEAEGSLLGFDYEYRVFDVLNPAYIDENLGGLLSAARAQGFSAVNITHPFKQRVLALVDHLDEHAAALQAVNLVVFDEGRLVGYNTDWRGFGFGLETGLPGASLNRVVQVGCGGAGAATAYSLLARGAARVDLHDADPRRAEDLARRLGAHYSEQQVSALASDDLAAALSSASGVVHATPMGMVHHPGVAVDLDALGSGAWVSDIVYRPLETELLRQARRRGHPTIDGGRMAVGQAYVSLQIITGAEPDIDRMQRHFRALVRAEEQSGGAGFDDRSDR